MCLQLLQGRLVGRVVLVDQAISVLHEGSHGQAPEWSAYLERSVFALDPGDLRRWTVLQALYCQQL